jgi:hypothetical protein
MQSYQIEAARFVDQINSLQEPYRQNAIAWLRSCTQMPLDDLSTEITSFLLVLNPVVREFFILNTELVLQQAGKYFGLETEQEIQPAGVSPLAYYDIPT